MTSDIEKILQEKGVLDLMNQKITENTVVDPLIVQTPETQIPPANVQTQDAPAGDKPNEQPAATVEKGLWDDIIEAKAPVQEDLNAKMVELETKFSAHTSKLEKNKILKQMYELVDSPGFDFEQFIETQRPKAKVDYNQYALEQLYKADLESDTVAGYTPQEIEELWEVKKAEIEGKTAIEKQLKSELVRKFDSTQVVSEEEPELIKGWREQKADQERARTENAQAQRDLNDGITNFAKSIVGKTVGGIVITQDHADAISVKMNADTYKGADGKIDPQKLGVDRLKAALFGDMVKYYKENAVIDARKQITNPSLQSGGGGVVDTDTRSESEKILMEAAIQQRLPADTFLKNKR
jgi:hypothetical protein